ncbi:hypothetical protein GQ44DRAFT_775300 [Phaeosphaeriaceae sp. PMI808]|nr:hypothetical protein GQ44DRAFT_775300 [Phaeosphaeriaceae sp. PMI808]
MISSPATKLGNVAATAAADARTAKRDGRHGLSPPYGQYESAANSTATAEHGTTLCQPPSPSSPADGCAATANGNEQSTTNRGHSPRPTASAGSSSGSSSACPVTGATTSAAATAAEKSDAPASDTT